VEEVAQVVGVSRVRLTKLELNQFEQLSVQELVGLCRFFGVGIEQLLEYVVGVPAEEAPAE
jgi:DNA-binding Xre family transcriptional regulator